VQHSDTLAEECDSDNKKSEKKEKIQVYLFGVSFAKERESEQEQKWENCCVLAFSCRGD
jgi:hypothetical protein